MVVEEAVPEVVTRMPTLLRLETDWVSKTCQPLLFDLSSKLGEMNLQQLSMCSGSLTHLPKDLTPFQSLNSLELKEQAFDQDERSRIVAALSSVDVRF